MHFENLLFILLIAMAALLRLLATRAGEAKKRPQKSDQRSTTTPQVSKPIRRAPVESDEERIRRFLEALGQPTTAMPPPPVVPRTDIPPRPLAPVQPPSGPFSPLRRVIRQATGKRSVILHESPVGTPGEWLRKEIAPASVETAARPTTLPGRKTSVVPIAASTPSATTNIEITTLLSSSTGLRNAIILREIFGPPRSLQPLDLVGSA